MPVKLFNAANPSGLINGRFFDVSSDGRRFIMIRPAVETSTPSAPQQLVVVVNWLEELKAKLNR